ATPPPGASITRAPPRSRSRFLAAAAEHLEADLLLGRVGAVLAHDLPLVDDEDAVRERQDLVQLERQEQDRAALVALLDEAPVDVLDRADVEPARRLGGDQHLRIALDLAGEDHLLLVPARQRSGAGVRAAAAHVEGLDQAARALDQPAREEPAVARVGR